MIENKQIRNSSCEKILVVFSDTTLMIQSHIDSICKKASQELNVIPRITPYMDFHKTRLTANVVFIAPISTTAN